MFSTGPTKHDKLNAVIARYRGQLTDKQTKFLSDYYPRYKGSIGDREYKVLGELGYEGSLDDRWNAYMRDLGGTGMESLDVLYKTFYGDAGYHENDKDPQLVVDTVNEFYRKDGEGTKGPLEKATPFNHVVKHNSSTAGNATMTGSYGPELVTNGDFSDGTTGWTTNGDVRVLSGQILVRNNTAGISDIRQTVSVTSGKLYEISFNFVDKHQGNIRVSIDDSSYQYTGDVLVENISSTGRYSFTFVATSSNAYIRLMTNSTTNGHSTTWDNISVREVPKIQWRPHNLLAYSEDVTSNKYVDFGSTGNVTFVDPTTITFAAGTANVSNKTLETTNLVGQQITGAIELSSQTHAGEKVQLRFNWRGGSQEVGDLYTLTTTPTFVYITATVPAGTTGVDLIVYHPVGEQVEKTFTATKWHVYRSDLGGMADVPMSERVHPSANTYVRTAGREVSGIELVENGTFDTDVSGWSTGGTSTITYSNGTIVVDRNGETNPDEVCYQSISTIAGRVYKYTVDVVDDGSFNSASVRVTNATTGGNDLITAPTYTNGTDQSITFEAESSTTVIHLVCSGSVNNICTFDNISVKEIDVDPSTARYLPRIGHHVYNGSQWVNEGLLHESGARTNIVPYSEDLSNSAWTKESSSVAAADDAFGLNMWTITDSTSSSYGLVLDYLTIPDNTQFTISVLVKKDNSPTSQFSVRLRASNGSTTAYVGDSLNVDDGTLDGSMWSTYRDHSSVEDWGTHWKLNVTGTFPAGYTEGQALQLFPAHNNTNGFGSAANTGSHVVGGIQVETGSVASSYIPTIGSTVTRAAETLTIEHENLPWPSPVVIGDELVTNGTFDADISGWSDQSSAGGSISWNASGYLELDAATATSRAGQDISVTTGSVYAISVTVIDLDGASSCALYLDGAGTAALNFASKGVGTHIIYYVAPDSTLNLSVRNFTTGTTALLDNISVKEINPLSVSIAMEGRMTYTDNDANNAFSLYDWFIAGNDYLRTYFQTNGGTGKITASQNDGGTFDGKSTGGSDFSPDALVPYSFAVRHGSNFINISSDGSSLVANTTPVNLPDASSTDLRLGKGSADNYIGTIRSFRIWTDDIADDGIIEASEPELQPTLSLSFDSTETSFIDFEWSE